MEMRFWTEVSLQRVGEIQSRYLSKNFDKIVFFPARCGNYIEVQVKRVEKVPLVACISTDNDYSV